MPQTNLTVVKVTEINTAKILLDSGDFDIAIMTSVKDGVCVWLADEDRAADFAESEEFLEIPDSRVDGFREFYDAGSSTNDYHHALSVLRAHFDDCIISDAGEDILYP